MRIGALDISKNRIGIAFSDEDNEIITFSTTLVAKNNKNFKEEFTKLFKKYNPDLTLIGFPVFNKPSKSQDFIKMFAHNYRYIIGKFDFVDESYSTFMETENLEQSDIKFIFKKQKRLIDEMVACSFIINYQKTTKTCDKIYQGKDYEFE